MEKRIDAKCKCKSSTGSTHLECCNICGLPLPKETWHFILSDHDISRVGAEVIVNFAEDEKELLRLLFTSKIAEIQASIIIDEPAEQRFGKVKLADKLNALYKKIVSKISEQQLLKP